MPSRRRKGDSDWRKSRTVPLRCAFSTQPSAETKPRAVSGTRSATSSTRRDARRIPALQRQHPGGEHLAGLFVAELLQRQLPPRLARHPQPVDMRLDPVVEPGEVAEVVMRRAYRPVAQQPKERRFISLL